MNDNDVKGKPIRILLVEDNEADVRLTKEALKDCRVTNTIDTAFDGEEAIAFLRKKGAYCNAARPDLILLDLNLPKKDGREVLADIKKDPDLKRIPVIVLTSSAAEKDVIKSYDLQTNAYVVKPVDLDQFTKVISCIEDFWLTIVKLPGK